MRSTDRLLRSPPLAGLLLALLAGCAHLPEQRYDVVVPAPPDPPRYRLEWVYRGSDDYRRSSALSDLLFGHVSAGESHRLAKPSSVVSDGRGLVYVSDTVKPPRIEIFDDVKKEVRMIGVEGPGQLQLPLGLALDPAGTIYVADARRRQALAFTPDGVLRATYGSGETLTRPTGVAVDAGRALLYVADTGGHRVQVFSLADGRLLRTIGHRGAGPGEFNYPEALAIGPGGALHVVDTMNFRYQVFDPDGRFVAEHGGLGQEPGRFARPKGIAVYAGGRVYVSDAAFNNVQVFDAEGRLLLWLGGPGLAPGSFQLAEGVFADGGDRVFVVDQLNQRVQRYRFLSGVAESAAPAATSTPGGARQQGAPPASQQAAPPPSEGAPARSAQSHATSHAEVTP